MSLVKTLLTAGFVGAVILIECFAAWMVIPSTADLEAQLKTKTPEKHGHEEDHAEHEEAHGASVEVELGKYNITVTRPSSEVTLKVNFVLIGTVTEHDHAPFEELLAKNQHRLRDKIIFEIRNCELTDLTDPGLGLIKRRILAKSNELLGKPILESVVFSEFSYAQM